MIKITFLPYKFKFLGFALIVIGCFFAVLYNCFGFSLQMPAFAIYSSFMQTKIFTIIHTNFADELILLLLIAGLLFLMFSEDRFENQHLNQFRIKALIYAIITNYLLLIFSILFIFGGGFMSVLIFNLFSILIIYQIFFYIFKKRFKNNSGNHNKNNNES